MSGTSALEQVLRRDRVIVAVGIAALVAIAWGYVLGGAGIDMTMADMPMEPIPWSASYAAVVFGMWWVMMVAMMVPSATPMVLLFTAIKRKQERVNNAVLEAWLFLGGYLVVWAGFSLVATMVQWGLERVGLLSQVMANNSTALVGLILLAAGIYQLTPIKRACLRYCESPLLFLSQYWQPGATGALRMGLRHGSYCVGCCWFLMALLFVSGIMNLAWIAGIALYVAFEKLMPNRRWLSRAAGIGLILSAALVFARAA
jgi:predicted metal-binding membrane protein